MKKRIRKWLFWKFDQFDDWLLDHEKKLGNRLTNTLLEHDSLDRFLCMLLEHAPIRDGCMLPEHDYCAWCGSSTPHQAHADYTP